MADEKTKKINTALQERVQEIDKLCMRGIQKQMYDCAAKCCESSTPSVEDVSQCIERCSYKYKQCNQYLTSQISNFQERLSRCVSQCNDEARDLLGANPNNADVERASAAFEKCASTCIDKHIAILPQFMSKTLEHLKQI